MRPPICPYHQRPAVLVDAAEVYGRSVAWARNVWVCETPGCDARVGSHKDTGRPLGSMANAELRRARIQAHAAFDAIWRGGLMKRGEAYRQLAGALGLPAAHIGEFSLEQCRQAQVWASGYQAGRTA